MQVAEVLPEPIQLKWSKMLVKEGVTTWKVEGQDYLDKLLNMIKRAYFTAEVQARIPGNDPTPKPKAKVNMTARDGSVSPPHPPQLLLLLTPTLGATTPGARMVTKVPAEGTRAVPQRRSGPDGLA